MPAIVDEAALLTDLRELIQSARERIATVANSTTTLLYWHLGRRLLTENLQDGRAAYGKRILATVSRELTAEFGGGFGYATVNRAIQFAQFFFDQAIVSTLSTQLSWSHFIELLPVKDPLARDFYAEMCRIERWDVRTLRLKIGGMLFQRTALSKKPQAVISAEIGKLRDGQMIPDTVFRDPYQSIYWLLCLESHNNMSALDDRHIEKEGDDYHAVLFKPAVLADLLRDLDALLAVAIDSGARIHSFLGTEATPRYESHKKVFDHIRQEYSKA